MGRPCRCIAPARRGARSLAALGPLATLVALALLCAGTALAASFQVSPTRFEFPLERRFTNFFTVTNNSGAPLRLRVVTSFVEIDAEGKMSELQNQPLDLAPWVVFNPRRVTLLAGEKRVVRFTVRPPEQLPTGEFRTVVFFEELPERPDEQAAASAESGFRIKLLTRVGITLYGQVGPLAAEIALRDPTVVVSQETLDVSALLTNAGNAHAQIAVTAELLGGADTVPAPAEERLTLQRTQQRRIRLQLQRPPPGTYRVRLTAASAERTWHQQELPVTIEPPAK